MTKKIAKKKFWKKIAVLAAMAVIYFVNNYKETPAKFDIGDLVALRESFYKYYGRDHDVNQCKYGIIMSTKWVYGARVYEVYWMPYSVILREMEHRLELLSKGFK